MPQLRQLSCRPSFGLLLYSWSVCCFKKKQGQAIIACQCKFILFSFHACVGCCDQSGPNAVLFHQFAVVSTIRSVEKHCGELPCTHLGRNPADDEDKVIPRPAVVVGVVEAFYITEPIHDHSRPVPTSARN